MGKIGLILANVLVWGGIVAYLGVSGRMSSRQQADIRVTEVDIVITDSAKMQFITPAAVKGWMREAGMNFAGLAMDEVNTLEIKELMLDHSFVKSAKVYTTLSGRIMVELTQRRPIARVNLSNGYNFYIADDGCVLPIPRNGAIYVPIVTGSFTPPFSRGTFGKVISDEDDPEKKSSENYTFYVKLINFVKFVEGSDFWRSQIEQINVIDRGARIGARTMKEPQIEVVPRVGGHVVLLGGLDGAGEKLDRLNSFYKGALEYEGWSAYRYVDLRFDNQIVCTK